MEKGLPLPPEPVHHDDRRPSHSRMRAWGLVLTFIGIALIASIAISSHEGIRHGTWGAIVLALGLALLIAAALEKRDADKRGKQ
jgi:peptidoglycan/LPS O-acetylase OafA/YrhL